MSGCRARWCFPEKPGEGVISLATQSRTLCRAGELDAVLAGKRSKATAAQAKAGGRVMAVMWWRRKA